jgi:hypothetical protein
LLVLVEESPIYRWVRVWRRLVVLFSSNGDEVVEVDGGVRG